MPIDHDTTEVQAPQPEKSTKVASSIPNLNERYARMSPEERARRRQGLKIVEDDDEKIAPK